MSDGKRVPYAEALELAERLAIFLAPVTQRINVAGSLRRGKDEVGDIELVCIPNQAEDLFGNLAYQWNAIPERLAQEKMIKGGNRYQQYEIDNCMVDIYVTTLEQWGVIFTIRTGSADFAHKLVTARSMGGYMPKGMCIAHGRLWKANFALETLTEQSLFLKMGLTWVPPEAREIVP